jgi:hypothetical protein
MQDQATTSPGLYDSKQMAQQLGTDSGGSANTKPSVVALLLMSAALDSVKVPPGTPNSMSSLDWSSLLS